MVYGRQDGCAMLWKIAISWVSSLACGSYNVVVRLCSLDNVAKNFLRVHVVGFVE